MSTGRVAGQSISPIRVYFLWINHDILAGFARVRIGVNEAGKTTPRVIIVELAKQRFIFQPNPWVMPGVDIHIFNPVVFHDPG
jgi:hypothetical protein